MLVRLNLPAWCHDQTRTVKLIDLDSEILGALKLDFLHILEALQLLQALITTLQAALCWLFIQWVSITDLRRWYSIDRKSLGKIVELDIIHGVL